MNRCCCTAIDVHVPCTPLMGTDSKTYTHERVCAVANTPIFYSNKNKDPYNLHIKSHEIIFSVQFFFDVCVFSFVVAVGTFFCIDITKHFPQNS